LCTIVHGFRGGVRARVRALFAPGFVIAPCIKNRLAPAKLVENQKRGITAGTRERPAGGPVVGCGHRRSIVKERCRLRKTGSNGPGLCPVSQDFPPFPASCQSDNQA